ncbi:MAG: hypothetical protein ABII76_09110 [Pseudomonadota bacterium]|uniref:hypothetical protein n=1 Tax=Roseixanthobacter finlandensis TaxID=3119922 RepID=UPI00372CB138
MAWVVAVTCSGQRLRKQKSRPLGAADLRDFVSQFEMVAGHTTISNCCFEPQRSDVLRIFLDSRHRAAQRQRADPHALNEDVFAHERDEDGQVVLPILQLDRFAPQVASLFDTISAKAALVAAG